MDWWYKVIFWLSSLTPKIPAGLTVVNNDWKHVLPLFSFSEKKKKNSFSCSQRKEHELIVKEEKLCICFSWKSWAKHESWDGYFAWRTTYQFLFTYQRARKDFWDKSTKIRFWKRYQLLKSTDGARENILHKK